jgi:hypothetical protein
MWFSSAALERFEDEMSFDTCVCGVEGVVVVVVTVVVVVAP